MGGELMVPNIKYVVLYRPIKKHLSLGSNLYTMLDYWGRITLLFVYQTKTIVFKVQCSSLITQDCNDTGHACHVQEVLERSNGSKTNYGWSNVSLIEPNNIFNSHNTFLLHNKISKYHNKFNAERYWIWVFAVPADTLAPEESLKSTEESSKSTEE